MTQYRKKPVVIDAIQLTDTNIKEVYEFVHSSRLLLKTTIEHDKWSDYEAIVSLSGMDIPTLEDGADGRAKHVATIGDWIIKGVKGEFYPCKPDIFEMTYELATAILEQEPQEPEPEPVVWKVKDIMGEVTAYLDKPTTLPFHINTPLYTSPPSQAIQSHSGEAEPMATLNSSYGSDTGWQYLIDLRHDLQTDDYLGSIHGHDIPLYLAPTNQSARIKELQICRESELLALRNNEGLRKKIASLSAQNEKYREALALCNFDASVFPKEERYAKQQIVVEARALLASAKE